jgi:glucosyl-dolichyl phosphate glucuronosyltransferase
MGGTVDAQARRTSLVTHTGVDVSVVICAYTDERWVELLAAIESCQRQTFSALEILVVVDHNDALRQRLQAHLDALAIDAAHPVVAVLANRGERGLAGARNTGIAEANGSVVAFLDDDATPAADWLARLTDGYANPDVLGVGGSSLPAWSTSRPAWFPPEFDWVVGCSHTGMPRATAPVRNLIGCNMSFRRRVFDDIGGFRYGLGRVGEPILRCEETEFCIRLRKAYPAAIVLYEPRAQVRHHVPLARARWSYFLSRCYAEGLSKARLAGIVGPERALESERHYVSRILPGAFLRGVVAACVRRQPRALGQSGAVVAGLAWTGIGFLSAR